MNIQELEDKHGDIPLEPLNFDEFYYIKHTKLSIEFAISMLEEIKPNISRTMKVFNKIQELKQYLNE